MNWIDALPWIEFWGATLLVLCALYGWFAVLNYANRFLKRRWYK